MKTTVVLFVGLLFCFSANTAIAQTSLAAIGISGTTPASPGPGVKISSPPSGAGFTSIFSVQGSASSRLRANDTIISINGTTANTGNLLARMQLPVGSLEILYRSTASGRLARESWRRTSSTAAEQYSSLLGMRTQRVSSGLKITHLAPGGYAQAQSLAVNNIITQVNSIAATNLQQVTNNVRSGNVSLRISGFSGSRTLPGPVIHVGGGSKIYKIEIKTRAGNSPQPPHDAANTGDQIELRLYGNTVVPNSPKLVCPQNGSRFRTNSIDAFYFVNAPNVGALQRVDLTLNGRLNSDPNDRTWNGEFVRVSTNGVTAEFDTGGWLLRQGTYYQNGWQLIPVTSKTFSLAKKP